MGFFFETQQKIAKYFYKMKYCFFATFTFYKNTLGKYT